METMETMETMEKAFLAMNMAEKFEAIANVVTNQEMKDFLMERATQVNKRYSYQSSKVTAKDIANDKVKKEIRAYLSTVEKPVQCKDIGLALGLSTNKVSAMMRQMEDVERSEIKKVAHFSLKK